MLGLGLDEFIADIPWRKTKYQATTDLLRISPKRATCDMQKYHNFWGPVNFADMLDHRFENRKEKRNLNQYELQFEMRTSLSFLSSRTKASDMVHPSFFFKFIYSAIKVFYIMG